MIVIQKQTDCCGCSACVEICPKECILFQSDKEGFWYPKVDLDICIDCNLCEKVCPILNPRTEHKPMRVYAALNKDESVRAKSASGGIFSIVAEKIIDEQGVVFGVKFDENWNVVFGHTQTREGLEAFRRSKYVQAWAGESYSQVRAFLKEGRKVLFSGVPCQIAGLKTFLRKDYENLLTLEVICEGVPSPKLWKKYLAEELDGCVKKARSYLPGTSIENEISIKDISFRDKTNGWSNFSFAIKFANDPHAGGKSFKIPDHIDRNSAYMQLMFQYANLRPICYECPFKSGKSHSDLTIADYWGISELHPEMDDNKGISMVFINTPKGANYCDIAKTRHIQTDYEAALKFNNIATSSKKHPKRDFFYAQIDSCKSIIGLMRSIRRPLSQRWTMACKRFGKKYLIAIFGKEAFETLRKNLWKRKK